VYAAILDARHAFRALARRPFYAALASLTLALGIGAATTIYSVVDGVLLKPLPYPEAERLVAVYRTFPKWRDQEALRARWDGIWFSYPALRDWSARQTAFDVVGGWASSQRTLGGVDVADQVNVVRSTSSLLAVLGVRPALGRFFLPDEANPPGARVAVVSYETWTTRFGGRPDIVGRTITLDGAPYEIVGVLPSGLDLTNRGRPHPIWVPAGGAPSDGRAGSTDYVALGRLKDGVSLSQAVDETRRLVAASSPPDPVGARLGFWRNELTKNVRRPLFLLLGAAAVLLVLACVNVSTLMLGESSGRIVEFATRVALGAGRGRVARQVMFEGLIVATGAVVLGTAFAAAGARMLVALGPANIPRLAQVSVDGRVLVVACAVGTVTALLAGLAPAITLTTSSPRSLLGSVGRATRQGEQWTLRSLVAAQVALSCVLLVGAALLGQTVRRLDAVDPGFQNDRLMLVGLGVTGGRHAVTGAATTAFFDEVAHRLAGIPGVERASVGSAAPFSGGGSSSSIVVEGQPLPPGATGIDARRSHVLPGFIETLGLRLLAGRTIAEQDRRGAPLVALVNQTMARRFWPTGSAIGQRVRFGDDWLTIVGVVSDVKHTSLSDTTRITLYLPAWQHETPYLTVLLRTRLDADAFTTAVRRTVAELDPAVPVTRIDAVPELVRQSFASERFRALLITVFASIAGLLATIGIYGVTARAVARQRREISIRVALGSSPWRVTGLLVGRTGWAVTLGVVVGLVGASALSNTLAPYLFATDRLDPTIYAGTGMVLALTALVAAWLPARTASRTDPASILRC
jgi:putative ABC transport system permease protein